MEWRASTNNSSSTPGLRVDPLTAHLREMPKHMMDRSVGVECVVSSPLLEPARVLDGDFDTIQQLSADASISLLIVSHVDTNARDHVVTAIEGRIRSLEMQ